MPPAVRRALLTPRPYRAGIRAMKGIASSVMFGPSNPNHSSFDKQFSPAKPIPAKVAFLSSSDSKFGDEASSPRLLSVILRPFNFKRLNLVSFDKCLIPSPESVGQSRSRQTRFVSDSSWATPASVMRNRELGTRRHGRWQALLVAACLPGRPVPGL